MRWCCGVPPVDAVLFWIDLPEVDEPLRGGIPFAGEQVDGSTGLQYLPGALKAPQEVTRSGHRVRS
jgi:hypothetical protein